MGGKRTIGRRGPDSLPLGPATDLVGHQQKRLFTGWSTRLTLVCEAAVLVDETDTRKIASLADMIAIASAWSVTGKKVVRGAESETVPASTGGSRITRRHVEFDRFYIWGWHAGNTWTVPLRSGSRKDISWLQVPAARDGQWPKQAFGYEKTRRISRDLWLVLEAVLEFLPTAQPLFSSSSGDDEAHTVRAGNFRRYQFIRIVKPDRRA
jgi:hypothetical protein